MAQVGVPTLDPNLIRGQLHSGVHEREVGAQVASVEGVNHLARERDVLLRHRPPSIPPSRGRKQRALVLSKRTSLRRRTRRALRTEAVA